MKPPKVIYLQWYDDMGDSPDSIGDEITWCQEQINETDLEYVLVEKERKDDKQ